MFFKENPDLLTVCRKPMDVPLDYRHYLDFGAFLFSFTSLGSDDLDREIVLDEPSLFVFFDLLELADDTDFFDDGPGSDLLSFLVLLSRLEDRDDELGDGVRALF